MIGIDSSRALALRNSIANGFQSDPDMANVSVSTHDGDFDLEALETFGKNPPAVVLSLRRFRLDLQGEFKAALCTFIAVCIEGDKPAEDKGSRALALADLFARKLATSDYVNPTHKGTRGPGNIQARGLYSAAIAAKGVAMWAITWDQKVDLGGSELEVGGALVPFLRFRSDVQLQDDETTGQTDMTAGVDLPQG